MNREGLVRMSRRRQRKCVKRQKRDRVWGYVRIAVIGLVSVFLLSVTSLLALFGYTYAMVSEDLPELDQYSAAELAQTSIVYDSVGNVVDELHGVQNRFVVGLDEIDPGLRDAVIAIEDQDRKSTRLNSSHANISYAVFCLKNKSPNFFS